LSSPKQDLQAAAKAAGLTTKLLKKYLKMPHVRRYYAAERRPVFDAYCAGTPAALKAIRDDSNNKMAAVAAVRGLELMRNETLDEVGGRGAGQAPGVTIIIEQPGLPDRVAAVIDAEHDGQSSGSDR
jgi:hypothetical protein